MNNNTIYILVFVCGLLTLGTNVITQVLKSVWKFPAQLLALIVAMVLTVVTFFAYAAIKGLAIEWYMVAGAVVMGFFVSYAAQFGFDKLRELIKQFTGR